MNNEPVSWAYIKDGEFWDAIHPDEHAQEEGSYTIPLYTHPVKELTDEEIDKIENAIYCKTIQKGKTQHEYIMAFARAILRKAQKK